MEHECRTDGPGDSRRERADLQALEEGFLKPCRLTVAAIRSGVGSLKPGEIDEITAQHLRREFGRLRSESVRNGFLELGEIGLAGETVFADVAKQAGGFRESELRFLANVAAALDSALDSIARSDPKPLDMELVGDGFDKLLMRLERA